jgi:hypothetical protein
MIFTNSHSAALRVGNDQTKPSMHLHNGSGHVRSTIFLFSTVLPYIDLLTDLDPHRICATP